MKIFLVAPNQGDLLTSVTSQWGMKVKKWLHSYKNEFLLQDFLEKRARTEKILPELEKDAGEKGVFIYLDHGNSTSLKDSEKNEILGLETLHLLENKFIYAIACRSGRTLGHDAVRKGAAGFLGFNGDYLVGSQEVIGKCLLEGLKALVQDEKTAAQARQQIVEMSRQEIRSLKKNPRYFLKNKEFIGAASILESNLDYLVHLGDPNWKIVE